jgi:hypothetical protein
VHRSLRASFVASPIARSTGAVGRSKAFRYDAFAPEFAGVVEYNRAFDVEMPIKGNTGMLLSEQPFEGQFAVLNGLTA